MASFPKLREGLQIVLSDLRSYYLFAALLLFSLLSARAGQMGVLSILGHVFLLVLLVGAIVLESKRRALDQELEQSRAENAELKSKTREFEAILLNQRIQMETERLRPHVEEIQRRLLAEFPQYAASFAVAETNGYVYPNELVMAVKAPDGNDVAPEDYNKVLAFARECAKQLDPELAIHWA